MNDEQPISFVGTTPSDDDTEEIHEFDEDAVITSFKVVTHRGQQYALQNYAYLVRDGSRTNLWKGLDRQFLAGNGQVYPHDCRFEVSEGDKLILQAENINTDGYDYHHNITVGIDRETGLFDQIANAARRVL